MILSPKKVASGYRHAFITLNAAILQYEYSSDDTDKNYTGIIDAVIKAEQQITLGSDL